MNKEYILGETSHVELLVEFDGDGVHGGAGLGASFSILVERNRYVERLGQLPCRYKPLAAIVRDMSKKRSADGALFKQKEDPRLQPVDVCLWIYLHRVVEDRPSRHPHGKEIGAESDGPPECSVPRAKWSVGIRLDRLE